MDSFVQQTNFVQLRLFVQSSYVDFNDINNPIKVQSEIRFLNLNLMSYTESTVNVVANNYEVDNDYLFAPTKTGDFFSVDSYFTSTYTDKMHTGAGYLGEIKVLLKPTKITHKVKVYNFYDFIAQLGGIYGLIFEIFSVCTLYFTKKIYEHSLVNTMNQCQYVSHETRKEKEEKQADAKSENQSDFNDSQTSFITKMKKLSLRV